MARGQYGDDDILVGHIVHRWRQRRADRRRTRQMDGVGGPRSGRSHSIEGFVLVVVGSLLGPYAAVWEGITWARFGGIHFPIAWYPFPIYLNPAAWYSFMVLGFALFGAGAVLAADD